jgi:hypothetical protein
MAPKQDIQDIIYEIVISDPMSKNLERYRITVPSNYKITYGKLHAGGGDGNRNYDSPGNCLRIYEAENKQRAVFRNVISFRDIGLPLVKKVDEDEHTHEGVDWVVVN